MRHFVPIIAVALLLSGCVKGSVSLADVTSIVKAVNLGATPVAAKPAPAPGKGAAPVPFGPDGGQATTKSNRTPVGPSQDVAGLGPTSQVALPTKAGAGLIKTPGSGLTGKTGSSLISQDGGGLLGTDKVAPLISQDGGGAVSHTTDTLLPTHPTTGLLGGGNPGPDANTGFVAKPGTGIGATADAPNPTPSVVPSAKPRLGVL